MYTIYFEGLANNGFTSTYGFWFEDFKSAFLADKEWAVEEWGDAPFNEFPSGFFTYQNMLIRVISE